MVVGCQFANGGKLCFGEIGCTSASIETLQSQIDSIDAAIECGIKALNIANRQEQFGFGGGYHSFRAFV